MFNEIRSMNYLCHVFALEQSAITIVPPPTVAAQTLVLPGSPSKYKHSRQVRGND
jgi:hypothetical protein